MSVTKSIVLGDKYPYSKLTNNNLKFKTSKAYYANSIFTLLFRHLFFFNCKIFMQFSYLSILNNKSERSLITIYPIMNATLVN